jgi:DNA-binding NarL/FixJ family response regulator
MPSVDESSAPDSSKGGPPDAKRRILIADDQSILRGALCALFEGDERLEVVGSAGDGRDALRCVGSLRPDVVLIDISMPNMDGLMAIREIKRRAPDAKALVLTVHRTEEFIRGALQAGADGYLLKDASRGELLMAIDSVLLGKTFISPAISGSLLTRYLEQGRLGVGSRGPFDKLSTREKQVLKLIAQGRRNREIAADLFISVKTVEKHRSNLMQKMNLHNTAALTSFAMENGLVGTAEAAVSAQLATRRSSSSRSRAKDSQ